MSNDVYLFNNTGHNPSDVIEHSSAVSGATYTLSGAAAGVSTVSGGLNTVVLAASSAGQATASATLTKTQIGLSHGVATASAGLVLKRGLQASSAGHATSSARLPTHEVLSASTINGSTTFGSVHIGQPRQMAGTIRPSTFIASNLTKQNRLGTITINVATTVTDTLGFRRALSASLNTSTALTVNLIPRFGGTVQGKTVFQTPIRLTTVFGTAATINGRTDLKSHYTTYHFVLVDTALGTVNLFDLPRGGLDGENLYTSTAVSANNLYVQRIRTLDILGGAAAAVSGKQISYPVYIAKSGTSKPAGITQERFLELKKTQKARQFYL